MSKSKMDDPDSVLNSTSLSNAVAYRIHQINLESSNAKTTQLTGAAVFSRFPNRAKTSQTNFINALFLNVNRCSATSLR